jgi:hypothetical protein
MRKRYSRRNLVQGMLTGLFALSHQHPRLRSGPRPKRPTTVAETRMEALKRAGAAVWGGNRVPLPATRRVTYQLICDGAAIAHYGCILDPGGARATLSYDSSAPLQGGKRTTYVCDPSKIRVLSSTTLTYHW